MTNKTENRDALGRRDDPASTKADIATDQAEDWWRKAPEDLQLTLRVLATPMSELGFDPIIAEEIGENMPLSQLLAIGDMQHIAEKIGDAWAVHRFRDRFEEPFLIGDLGVDLHPSLDLTPLPPLPEGGRVRPRGRLSNNLNDPDDHAPGACCRGRVRSVDNPAHNLFATPFAPHP